MLPENNMETAMVVAATENNVIGKNNKLLWRLPDDMRFFKNITIGHPVVMGRKTFEALSKPLVGRTNIVITGQPELLGYCADAIVICTSIETALAAARATGNPLCCIIGGGEIYRQCWHTADILYLTRVHTVLGGDAYIPAVGAEWQLVDKNYHAIDDNHAFAFTIETYRRAKYNIN